MCGSLHTVLLPGDDHASRDARTATDSTGAPDDVGLEAARELIRRELRKARRARGLSQEQLGDQVDASRFTINRLENGQVDLHPDLAQRLDTALGTMLATLVAKRDQGPETTSNAVASRLLHTPSLQRVRIVIADLLDVAELLRDNVAIANARVEVIVPSARREKQLFGGRPLYPHIENQLRRLRYVSPAKADAPATAWGAIEAFESETVLFSAILIRSPAGMECAYWPSVLSEDSEEAPLPAVASRDARVAVRVDRHIDAVKAAGSPIRDNEALGILEPAADGTVGPLKFTRFARRLSEAYADLGENEGAMVSLVLVHAVCPRRGLEVGRRVVVYRRPGRARWSLISHGVDELDVRRAKLAGGEEERLDLTRSSGDPLDAVYEHYGYLTSNVDGTVPERVFKEGAVRELFATFGLKVEVGRLRRRVTPPQLQRIEKPESPDDAYPSPRIFPRLFDLDLTAHGPQARPELSLLKERADVEEWGYEDFRGRSDLNDFLERARDVGYLDPWLRDLGVVPR